jgi:nicotinic acid mononucleotide adenylyltransferase
MVRDGWDAKLLPMPLIHASSTDIRKSIKENKQVNNLEKPVFEYIEEHGLYKD